MLAMSVSPSKPTSPSLASHNHLESNACELVRLTDESPNTQVKTKKNYIFLKTQDELN